MSPGGPLSQRQLNRAVLARQGLLEPFGDALPQVLERVGGIQSQYAPSMYVGLWSRMRGFERAQLTRVQLTRALEERDVVQGTLLRTTIHLVSRVDYWPFATAVRDVSRDWFVRTSKGDPSREEIDAEASKLRDALVAGPLRQADRNVLACGHAVRHVKRRT